jgi:hypothetical protein
MLAVVEVVAILLERLVVMVEAVLVLAAQTEMELLELLI